LQHILNKVLKKYFRNICSRTKLKKPVWTDLLVVWKEEEEVIDVDDDQKMDEIIRCLRSAARIIKRLFHEIHAV
jgi:hypothetical protein